MKANSIYHAGAASNNSEIAHHAFCAIYRGLSLLNKVNVHCGRCKIVVAFGMERSFDSLLSPSSSFFGHDHFVNIMAFHLLIFSILHYFASAKEEERTSKVRQEEGLTLRNMDLFIAYFELGGMWYLINKSYLISGGVW